MIYEKNDIRNLIFGLCNNYASMNDEEVKTITRFAQWCSEYIDCDKIIENEITEGGTISERLKHHKTLFLSCNNKISHRDNNCFCKEKGHI